ncbi:MAG: hypothetical protein Q9165_002892 [Trypethelium subeluteriae]
MPLLIDFIYRQFIHSPPDPIASFDGKIIIVTGSSSGLGLEACRSLVRRGVSRIILACRNVEKAKAAARDIQATTSCSTDILQVWQLDMSSYASVQAFSDRVESELPRLDVLLGNAGLGTREFRITEDNEEMITTNVVSTFLLGFLLHPKLRETAKRYSTQTYFTVTTSELYEYAKFEERKAPTGQIFATLNDRNTANMGERYDVSKLLQVFVIKQMASLYPCESSGVIVNGVAPGFCRSELTRDIDSSLIARFMLRILCRRPEVGARTLVNGASAGVESHGQYVPDCKITPTKGLTEGPDGVELQRRIWEELKQKLETIRPGVTSLS